MGLFPPLVALATKQVGDWHVTTRAIHMRISKQDREDKTTFGQPLMNTSKHHPHVPLTSVGGMDAHLCNAANAIRAASYLNLFLVNTDVGYNPTPLVTYNPSVWIRFAEVTSISEHHILRLGKAQRQQAAEFQIQRIVNSVVREIFDFRCYRIWHSIIEQRAAIYLQMPHRGADFVHVDSWRHFALHPHLCKGKMNFDRKLDCQIANNH